MRAWIGGVVAVVAVSAWGGDRPVFGPKEIIERLEASPVQFAIKDIGELTDVARGRLADETWRLAVQPVPLPKVERKKDGSVTIAAWPEPPAARGALDRAETAFQAKQYAEAAGHYRKALQAAPKLYLARAYLGDALLFGGDAAAALAEYDAAIALNADDYRLYFFRATAHRHLGAREKMVADLRASLALKPRNDLLLGMVERSQGQLGLRLEPDLFVPRAFVRREGDVVVIYADAGRPEWLAWANCKALWLGDAPYRKERVGRASPGWSSTEELECLANLLGVYEARKQSGEGMSDDRLDRLVKITRDGLALGFVVYEFGSRVDSQVVLRLDPKVREVVRRYVDAWVLTEQKD